MLRWNQLSFRAGPKVPRMITDLVNINLRGVAQFGNHFKLQLKTVIFQIPKVKQLHLPSVSVYSSTHFPLFLNYFHPSDKMWHVLCPGKFWKQRNKTKHFLAQISNMGIFDKSASWRHKESVRKWGEGNRAENGHTRWLDLGQVSACYYRTFYLVITDCCALRQRGSSRILAADRNALLLWRVCDCLCTPKCDGSPCCLRIVLTQSEAVLS